MPRPITARRIASNSTSSSNTNENPLHRRIPSPAARLHCSQPSACKRFQIKLRPEKHSAATFALPSRFSAICPELRHHGAIQQRPRRTPLMKIFSPCRDRKLKLAASKCRQQIFHIALERAKRPRPPAACSSLLTSSAPPVGSAAFTAARRPQTRARRLYPAPRLAIFGTPGPISNSRHFSESLVQSCQVRAFRAIEVRITELLHSADFQFPAPMPTKISLRPAAEINVSHTARCTPAPRARAPQSGVQWRVRQLHHHPAI